MTFLKHCRSILTSVFDDSDDDDDDDDDDDGDGERLI